MRNILSSVIVISALFTGFSANAQGSMAPDVRVIEVKPSRSIIRLGEERRQYRESVRERQREGRALIQRMERDEREYRRDMERRIKELDKKMHCKRFKSC